MSGTRKLAAILVADVVGYSRLAGADADRTLSRLRALCRMTAMARTPVLPEATPEGALSAQLRRRTAIRYVRCTSTPAGRNARIAVIARRRGNRSN
jgi:hypothetical protein